MSDITVKVEKEFCVLSERSSGWQLEFNLVSWNGNEPKYDLRPWNEDHSKCGEGITLTEDELKKLVDYCNAARLQEV